MNSFFCVFFKKYVCIHFIHMQINTHIFLRWNTIKRQLMQYRKNIVKNYILKHV